MLLSEHAFLEGYSRMSSAFVLRWRLFLSSSDHTEVVAHYAVICKVILVSNSAYWTPSNFTNAVIQSCILHDIIDFISRHIVLIFLNIDSDFFVGF